MVILITPELQDARDTVPEGQLTLQTEHGKPYTVAGSATFH